MIEHQLEFTASENPWAPSAVVEEINARMGSGLELVGLADQRGGTSSAAYVQWPDGRQAALTRTNTSLDAMLRTADVLAIAHARGLPVPRHELVLRLDDGRTAVVQERLPGRHARRIDAEVVDAMVAMNERFAGLLADRPDVPAPSAFPPSESGTHPWQDTLGAYDDRSRRLLGRVERIADGRPYEMTGDDLVHTDYSLGNVLWDGHTRISGVVDWNRGVVRGDRRFALFGMGVHLRNEGDGYIGTRAAIDRLDEVLRETIEPDVLRIYWTHWTVHNAHWAIQHGFRADRIDHDIRLAEEWLG